MTTIAWEGGGPVFKNGTVGEGQGCCCGVQCGGPCDCVCNCVGGNGRRAPHEMIISFTVLDVWTTTFPDAPAECTDAGFRALLDGQHTLQLDSVHGSYALYSGQTPNGGELLFQWYCNGGGLLSHRYCDLNQPCYQRMDFDVWFQAPARPLPGLCDISGQPVQYQFEVLNGNVGFNTGLITCTQANDYTGRYYDANITIMLGGQEVGEQCQNGGDGNQCSEGCVCVDWQCVSQEFP